jgi:hypothetical protein
MRLGLSLIKLISIQPLGRFWQEPEPSQATGMALARCILGKFLGVVLMEKCRLRVLENRVLRKIFGLKEN